jgi:hypothetical protein
MEGSSPHKLKGHQDIIDHARHQVRMRWKRTPRCNLHKTYICHCGQDFFDIHELKRWMDTKEDGFLQCNAERLVKAILPPAPHFFEVEKVFQGETSSVLVLGYLLLNNHEKLLCLFCSAGLTDKNIANTVLGPSYSKLKESWKDLKKYLPYSVRDIETIIDHFEEARWAFCPAEIGNPDNKEQEFKSRTRLPFFELSRINQKGGTASVIKVSVQKQFVSKHIRDRLGDAPGDHPGYGEVRAFGFLWPMCKLKLY